MTVSSLESASPSLSQLAQKVFDKFDVCIHDLILMRDIIETRVALHNIQIVGPDMIAHFLQ